MFERRLLGGLRSSGLQYGMTSNQSFVNTGLRREFFKLNQQSQMISRESIERSQKLSIAAQLKTIFGTNAQVRFFAADAN
jgi:hypothetical protein